MEQIKENKMGSAKMLPLLVSMSLPNMFSMLIQALYNIVDSIFVARYSLTALSAISLVFPVQMFITSIAVGTAIGINSLVSRRLGEARIEEAKSAATHGMLLSLVGYAFICVLAFFFTEPFYSLFTEDATMLNMACFYSNIVVYFSFGIMVQIAIEKILQATGNMIIPMLLQLLGAITNIILDPILIFGLGKIPSLGIEGAAIATVISQIFAMVFSLFIAFLGKHEIKISFKNFKLRLRTVKDIYAVGFPSIIMQSIGSVLISCLNAILITFGDIAVAVLGVYYKLQSFVFMPVFGITNGAMPIMGYSYGARNKKRLLSALKLSCILAFCIMLTGTLVFMLIPSRLLSIFNNDASLISMGIPALRIISICFPFAGICIMFSTMFQAMGCGNHSLLISFMRQLICLLPVAYLLSKIGLIYFWWSFPIAESVSVITSLILFIHLYRKDIRYLD